MNTNRPETPRQVELRSIKRGGLFLLQPDGKLYSLEVGDE